MPAPSNVSLGMLRALKMIQAMSVTPPCKGTLMTG